MDKNFSDIVAEYHKKYILSLRCNSNNVECNSCKLLSEFNNLLMYCVQSQDEIIKELIEQTNDGANISLNSTKGQELDDNIKEEVLNETELINTFYTKGEETNFNINIPPQTSEFPMVNNFSCELIKVQENIQSRVEILKDNKRIKKRRIKRNESIASVHKTRTSYTDTSSTASCSSDSNNDCYSMSLATEFISEDYKNVNKTDSNRKWIVGEIVEEPNKTLLLVKRIIRGKLPIEVYKQPMHIISSKNNFNFL